MIKKKKKNSLVPACIGALIIQVGCVNRVPNPLFYEGGIIWHLQKVSKPM